MNQQEIYTMKLHEIIQISEYRSMFRVAGGWIYQNRQLPMSEIFVPFNNEFMNVFENAI